MMGKPFRCKMGIHHWEESTVSKDKVCKDCGKVGTRRCFLCKKELKTDIIQNPKFLENEGRSIPEKMTDDDEVCDDCFGSLKISKRPNGNKRIFAIVLLIAMATLILLSIFLGEPNLFPNLS